MNKNKIVIYYMAVIAAFVTTQAPFWVARKASAQNETAQTKRAYKPRTASVKNATAKAITGVPHKLVAPKQTGKPYKAISNSIYTFDPERNILVCEHGEGLKLELPVTLKEYTGNPMDYVARLPKSKNALCGLPVVKKGEKGEGASQQCGLVIDESRLTEASIVMGEKLKSLKPKHAKTTVAQAAPAPIITE